MITRTIPYVVLLLVGLSIGNYDVHGFIVSGDVVAKQPQGFDFHPMADLSLATTTATSTALYAERKFPGRSIMASRIGQPNEISRKRAMAGRVGSSIQSSRKRMATKVSMARSAFSESLRKAVKWTRSAAVKSASIYMDPAAKKIAKVTVSWEPDAALLIRKKQKEHRATAGSRPFMVGVVGIPGSGKSTSCDILKKYLGRDSIVMPMDGYHLPMSALEQFPNSVDMIYRRGAPDTFDPASLKQALDRIVNGGEKTVSMPGFDHAKGDPEADQHKFVRSKHNVVICEGIYLMHDHDGWEDIKSYFDWTIYIAADVDKCIDRLKERNKCIPGYTPEEIEIRCDAVDRVNAMMVEQSRQFASQEVLSCAK